MPLRHLFLVVFISATTSALAQEPQTPQEPLVQQAAEPGQDAQAAQETQPANIQTPETKIENPAEPESHGTRLRWQDIPKNVLHDQKAIWMSPFHINRENAKWWVLFGGATAALISVDQRISDDLPQKTFLTKPS